MLLSWKICYFPPFVPFSMNPSTSPQPEKFLLWIVCLWNMERKIGKIFLNVWKIVYWWIFLIWFFLHDDDAVSFIEWIFIQFLLNEQQTNIFQDAAWIRKFETLFLSDIIFLCLDIKKIYLFNRSFLWINFQPIILLWESDRDTCKVRVTRLFVSYGVDING